MYIQLIRTPNEGISCQKLQVLLSFLTHKKDMDSSHLMPGGKISFSIPITSKETLILCEKGKKYRMWKDLDAKALKRLKSQLPKKLS